jgi:heme A synthase
VATGERRLGIVLAIGLLAVQVLVAIAALRTGVEAAWAVWIRAVLFAALVVEAVVLWRLLRARRESLADAVSSGGMFVVTVLAIPLIFSW